MDIVLRTHALTKQYKRVTAVRDLNMTIERGQIYGFLGQNGAGKTTTLRMMLGLIHPTSGHVELFGERAEPHKYRNFARIGSVIEVPGFYPNLTVAENLDIHRRLMGMENRNSIEESLEAVGLLPVQGRFVKTLSLGMKQRLGIARALLHRPELLILDEPINGLDPIGIKEVRQLLHELVRRRSMTVLFSSHILTEVEHLATKIGFIARGQLLEEIMYDDLQRKNRHYLELKVSDDRRASLLLEQQLGLQDYLVVEQGVLRLFDGLGDAPLINRLMIENGVDVGELKLVRDSLEDYFVRLTGGQFDV
ncbi:MAG: ABC transporter ATP-binding protein [Tumebacillaceae bacterium]